MTTSTNDIRQRPAVIPTSSETEKFITVSGY
jgi:hypothetical protein